MNKRLLSNAAPPGENAGKILEPTAVARQLVVAGPMRAGGRLLEASPGASLEVPAGVATKELRVVAFVQERASRRILGSGTRDVGAIVGPCPSRCSTSKICASTSMAFRRVMG